jgi:hypothetical protein
VSLPSAREPGQPLPCGKGRRVMPQARRPHRALTNAPIGGLSSPRGWRPSLRSRELAPARVRYRQRTEGLTCVRMAAGLAMGAMERRSDSSKEEVSTPWRRPLCASKGAMLRDPRPDPHRATHLPRNQRTRRRDHRPVRRVEKRVSCASVDGTTARITSSSNSANTK